MKLKSVLWLLCMLPVSSFAGKEWMIRGVTVEDVSVYYEDGYNVVTVKFEPASPGFQTGCAPTDAHHIVSYWTTSPIAGNASSVWTSVLLSAQAQNFPVDLSVDPSQCNTSSDDRWDLYGDPQGLGHKFHGVRAAKN